MARKAQAIQLQVEVETDDEWDKLLQRTGLIFVDVFAGWAGPCAGMIGILKKIKMEFGGDNLHLAIAKSDEITVLERFRSRCEPTWMFISQGKLVNIVFGCNAPQLTRLLMDEIQMENLVISGEKTRDKLMEVTDLTPDEQERVLAEEEAQLAAQLKAEAKRAKALNDRLNAEAKTIYENVLYCTVMILPNAKETYQKVLQAFVDAANLMIHSSEKVQMDEEKMETLLYFCEDKEEQFNEDSLEELYSDTCLWVLIKVRAGSDVLNLDDAILKAVYGDMKMPPGVPDCPYDVLYQTVETQEESEEGEEDTVRNLIGIWVPPNPKVRATSLKMFFGKYTKTLEIPEPEPTPPYLAVVLDNFQIPQAKQLMMRYPNEILNYGFFTTDDLENTKLVAKSFRRLESPEITPNRTYKEKLIVQLSRKKSECVLAFAQLPPIYMSPNTDEGVIECQLVFPDEYEESLDEDDFNYEEIEEEISEEIEDEEEEEGEEEMEESLEDEEGEEEGEEEAEDDDDFDFQDMFQFEPEVIETKPVSDVSEEGEGAEGG